MKRLIALAALLPALALTAPSAPPPPPGTVPLEEVPTLPGQVTSGEALEPDVRIIQRNDQEVREYRVNGRLYMVRIEPRNAPPYYLIDTDGDGELDTRQHNLDPGIMVPMWMILRW